MAVSLRRRDVIIVGGGPAGLSTALHLVRADSRWARRLLVLEKSRYPRPKLCGGGLSPTSQAVLASLGVDLPIRSFLCEHPLVRLHGSAFSAPVPLRIVRREEFDAALARECRERGIEIEEETSVEGVEVGADAVRVFTNRGELGCEVVVGADGITSRVRRALGLSDEGRPLASLLEAVVPVSASHPLFQRSSLLADFSLSHEGRLGYYWEFPCFVNGEAALNCGVFDNRLRHHEAPARSLLAILRERMEASHFPQVPVQGYTLRNFHKGAVMSAPRALLVGDAAGVDPLFGEGIGYALFHGRKAAQSIVRAFFMTDFSLSDFRLRFLASSVGKNLLWRCRAAEFLARSAFLLSTPLAGGLLRFSERLLPRQSLLD